MLAKLASISLAALALAACAGRAAAVAGCTPSGKAPVSSCLRGRGGEMGPIRAGQFFAALFFSPPSAPFLVSK